jgi:hypothetical protein
MSVTASQDPSTHVGISHTTTITMSYESLSVWVLVLLKSQRPCFTKSPFHALTSQKSKHFPSSPIQFRVDSIDDETLLILEQMEWNERGSRREANIIHKMGSVPASPSLQPGTGSHYNLVQSGENRSWCWMFSAQTPWDGLVSCLDSRQYFMFPRLPELVEEEFWGYYQFRASKDESGERFELLSSLSSSLPHRSEHEHGRT